MNDLKCYIFKYLTRRKYLKINIDSVDYTKSYILYLLNKHPTLSPSAITEEIKIKPQALANTLKVMENEGLITRQINPDNKRMTDIYITQKGAILGKQYCDEELARITKMIEYLGEEDTQQLVRLMQKLEDFMETQAHSSPKK